MQRFSGRVMDCVLGSVKEPRQLGLLGARLWPCQRERKGGEY